MFAANLGPSKAPIYPCYEGCRCSEWGASRISNRPVGAESRKTCAVKIASGFFDRYLSGNASGQTYHTLAIDKDLSRNSNMHCQGAKEAPLLPFNRAQALT